MRLIVPQRALSDNFFCFTTTREGGVSKVPYDALNLADHVSDLYQDVSENRKRLFDVLIKHAPSGGESSSRMLSTPNIDNAKCLYSKSAVAPLKFLHQTHSSAFVHYRDIQSHQTTADAVFTNQVRAPLAVLTADCLPIVLCSKVGNEYAAVHAGWKGIIGGVIENTLTAFTTHTSNISAWIGPAICQNHFEVEHEVANQFQNYEFAIINGVCENKHHIDLSAIATQIMRQLGIQDIQQSRVCTYCRDDLFSFRQATHNGFKECGRMATVLIKY